MAAMHNQAVVSGMSMEAAKGGLKSVLPVGLGMCCGTGDCRSPRELNCRCD